MAPKFMPVPHHAGVDEVADAPLVAEASEYAVGIDG
jgi:hypothetical protein